MIPCKDCLLVPACRHKPFGNLIADCEIIHGQLYKTPVPMKSDHTRTNFIQMVEKLWDLFRPTRWKIHRYVQKDTQEIKIMIESINNKYGGA